MMQADTYVRVSPSIRNSIPFASTSLILALLILPGLSQPGDAQETAPSASAAGAPLSTELVVQNLVRMNFERAQALHAYQGTRTYRIEYRGFPGTRNAEMVVNVNYASPGTKDFVVQSATGSKLLIDKVLKKLLEAEKEALNTDVQRRAALNQDNYEFTQIGYESSPSGAMYVLRVEPRTKDKFLYRGRIWIDADDFAVVRVEAEPAKNPSFWIKSTEVEQVYLKVGDYWLPAHNRSVSAIRLGGRAELTIDYRDYEITGAQRVSRSPLPRTAVSDETARAQQ